MRRRRQHVTADQWIDPGGDLGQFCEESSSKPHQANQPFFELRAVTTTQM
jgi:hypothetical protein